MSWWRWLDKWLEDKSPNGNMAERHLVETTNTEKQMTEFMKKVHLPERKTAEEHEKRYFARNNISP